MSEQFLHGADVGAVFEQVRGKRVAQDVRGDGFGYSGLAGGLAHGSLDVDLMQVMTAGASGARVDRKSGRGKHVLPAPFAGASAVFEGDAVGQLLQKGLDIGFPSVHEFARREILPPSHDPIGPKWNQ